MSRVGGRNRNRNQVLAAAVGGAVASLVAWTPGQVAAGIWTNNSGTGDNLWGTATNWSPSGAPSSSVDATFDDTSPTGALVNGAYPAVRRIYFTKSGGYTLGISGTPLLSYHGGVTVQPTDAAAATYNINVPMQTSAAGTSIDLYYGSILNVNSYIGGGRDITVNGSGTVNVSGNLATTQVLSVASGVTLTNSYTYAPATTGLVGSGTVTATNPSFTWRLDHNVDRSFQGLFNGTTALEKRGAGTWTLSGDGRYEGTNSQFYLNRGTLELDYTATGKGNVNRITNTTGVRAAGKLLITGSSEVDTLEAVGTLAAGSAVTGVYNGLGDIVVNHGTGKNATLNFSNTAAIVSNAGSMLRFGGADFAAASGNSGRVYFGSAGVVPAANNGLLGGFAVVGDEFAAYDHAGVGVKAYSNAARPASIGTDGTQNVQLDAPQALGADGAANSLRINGDHAVGLGGTTLTLTSGGLIQTGANNTAGITNGTVKAGATGTGTLYITAANDLTLGANVQAARVSKIGDGKLTVPAGVTLSTPTIGWYEGSLDYQGAQDISLQGSGNGAGTLTKGGAGTMTVTRNLVNTGGIDVQGGVLKVTPDGSNPTEGGHLTGAGGIDVASGATLWLSSSMTVAGYQWSGDGKVTANSLLDGTGTRRTLTSNGGTWSPGNSAGVLTVDGSLTFGLNGSTYSQLVIDVAGSGTVAGVDFDQLAVLGNVSGLANVDLVVNVLSDHAGPITILSSGNTTGTLPAFHSVSFVGGTGDAPTYGMNYVQLGNLAAVPEPGSVSLVALGAVGLLARRRRRGA